MKILRGLSANKEQPTTSPFPEKNGFFIEFRGGDFLHPKGDGKWFEPPYFGEVTHFWLPISVTYLLAIILPAISAMAVVMLYQYGMAAWPYVSLTPAFLCNPGMFISWRFGNHGGYIGAKAYGVDSPEYKKWPAMKNLQHEIYDGSQAIMFSVRPHATLG